MAMLGILGLILPLLFSGPVGNDLLDYIDTATYWQMKGVTVTVESMQKELRTSQAKPKNVASLVRDLGSSSFKKREAATLRLKDIGPSALPELKKAAASDDVEVSSRARKLVAELSIPAKAREVRRLMAIRTLGELEAKTSLSLLGRLASSKDFFTADYAKTAISAIEGKKYDRPGAKPRELQADLACLPAKCHAVAQIQVGGGKPLDFGKLMEKMQTMMGAMGGQPDEMPDMLQQITGAVLSVADRVGNIRIDAATIGIDGTIDDDNGFVTLIVRGVCDAKAIRSALGDMGVGAQKIGGIAFYSPEDEMVFGPVSDRRFSATFGPNRLAMPIETIVKSLKETGPKPKLNEKISALIKQVDTKKTIWAAVSMTETYKQMPMFGIFDTVKLTGGQDGKHMAFDLVATGSDAEQVKSVVETVREGIVKAQGEMAQAAERGGPQADVMKESMKPIADFLSSVKLITDGKTARASARLEADSSAVMMIPVMFFGAFRSTRMVAEPMPPPVEMEVQEPE